jgi:hypothetical protein
VKLELVFVAPWERAKNHEPIGTRDLKVSLSPAVLFAREPDFHGEIRKVCCNEVDKSVRLETDRRFNCGRRPAIHMIVQHVLRLSPSTSASSDELGAVADNPFLATFIKPKAGTKGSSAHLADNP